ncbi:MAG: porin [Rhodospirillaceae bacterium]|jgi:outer membrane protein OmpU|nr:porin [Rhodospirillaceae bacterium]MBT7957161.1 porin [Rhodospirillaceae bacterium]
MKKSLYMTTALAAAGVLALGATDAVAAEKAKKMSIANGGFFKSMIAFAQNDGSFESTTSGTSRTHYDAFNIVNDSEIYFKGNTKLDSGVRVDVIVQFETDAVKGGATIDESYVKLTGGFGDIRIGTTKAGSFVLKHSSPMPGAINLETPDSNLFVIRPAATSSVGTASHIGGGDSMKIVYISPIFSGFRVGGSYTPSNTATDAQPAVGGTAGTETQTYDAMVQYKTNMGSTKLGVDLGYWETHGAAASSLKAWRLGANLGFGAITLGGGYKVVEDLDTTTSLSGDPTNESKVYTAGVQYAAGGMKVGLGWVNEVKPMTAAIAGDDEGTKFALGGSFQLGTGVDFVGTLVHVDWDDEATTKGNNNDGWAVIGGIKVSF